MMRDSGINVKLDIDDLIDKLEAMKEDDYVTVSITIKSDGYINEVELSAVSIEDDNNISYGVLEDIGDDFL